MTLQPTLELHPHLSVEDADVQTRCCFCFNKRKVKEYTVDERNRIVPCYHKLDHRARIIANARLAELLRSKFESDPIASDIAFERLKMRINDEMHNGDPITSEKLVQIINAIHEIKEEVKREQS